MSLEVEKRTLLLFSTLSTRVRSHGSALPGSACHEQKNAPRIFKKSLIINHQNHSRTTCIDAFPMSQQREKRRNHTFTRKLINNVEDRIMTLTKIMAI
jgi:hypothetical protein